MDMVTTFTKPSNFWGIHSTMVGLRGWRVIADHQVGGWLPADLEGANDNLQDG